MIEIYYIYPVYRKLPTCLTEVARISISTLTPPTLHVTNTSGAIQARTRIALTHSWKSRDFLKRDLMKGSQRGINLWTSWQIFSMIWVILEVLICQRPVFICQPGDLKYFPIFGEFDGLYIINAFHVVEGASKSKINQYHWVSKQLNLTFWNLKKLGLTNSSKNKQNLKSKSIYQNLAF